MAAYAATPKAEGQVAAKNALLHAVRSYAQTHAKNAASARSAFGSMVPATTTAGTDPSGDNGSGFDPRGDLLALAVSDNGTNIAVGAQTFEFDDPSTSYNWQALALGDPAFVDGTGLVWGLDIDGDGLPNYEAIMVSDGVNVVAVVASASDTKILCDAVPSWNPSSGYFVAFPASCIGRPARVRAQAFMVYETATDESQDITGWTAYAKPPAAPKPPPKPAPKPAAAPGYWMVGATGTVYAFGSAHFYGSVSTSTVTHLEPTPSHAGYWVVNAAGQVSAFGNAHWHGNASGLAPGETVSSLSTTATGNGYWLFTNRGRALPFGDAHFYGDMSGTPINGPIVGSVATPSGHGYYMVASDGGIFTFGDAHFHGSMGGTHLNKPVNGLVPTPDNRGYWLVASDGGIFAFRAPFRGSAGGLSLNRPVIGIVRYGNGYLMVGSDGGIFDFSNRPFVGSLGANPPGTPIVGVGSTG